MSVKSVKVQLKEFKRTGCLLPFWCISP